MAYFNICPNCGSNLDPGEKCDCEQEQKKREEFMESHMRAGKAGQLAFVWDSKEAGYATKTVN